MHSDRRHSSEGLGPAFVVVLCLAIAAGSFGLALASTIGKLRDELLLDLRRFTPCAGQAGTVAIPHAGSAALRLVLRTAPTGPPFSCAAADVRVWRPGPHCLELLVHRQEPGAAAVLRAMSDGHAAAIDLPAAPVGRHLVLPGLEAEDGLIDVRFELESDAPAAAVLELARLHPCGGESWR